jgi:hypothetical protein
MFQRFQSFDDRDVAALFRTICHFERSEKSFFVKLQGFGKISRYARDDNQDIYLPEVWNVLIR